MKLIINKTFQTLLLFVFAGVTFWSCEEDPAEKLTGEYPAGDIADLSSRITGFATDITGAGAILTANGTDLSEVKRVFVGGIMAWDVEATETSVSCTVPTTGVPLGEQEVIFIFSGNGRAYATINVVPIPVINYFDPIAGDVGTEVTITGANLDIVDAVSIGGAVGTIINQTADQIRFTVPAGATTSSLVVESGAGNIASTVDFIACESDPMNKYCLTPVNVNGNFEAGTLGVIATGQPGAHGGNWFLAGAGTRANYELIAQEGYGLGEKTLQVTLLTVTGNPWDIQIVNDGYPVSAGKRFIWFGRVWADASGRRVRVAGGVSSPGYQDMLNTTDFTLVQGWNLLQINTQHIMSGNPPQDNTQFRAQMNLLFPENEGATFLFDDMRVVVPGDYVDCAVDPDSFFALYPQVTECP